MSHTYVPIRYVQNKIAEIAQRRKPAETPIITPEPAAPGTAPEPANTDAAIDRLEAQIALMRDELLGTIHRVETKVDKLLAIWDAMDDK